MEDYSISDIMWNLKSAFQEVSYRDAELALIRREQKLKMETIEMQGKYMCVLKENKDLKKQCDEFRRDNKGEVRRRSESKEKFDAEKIGQGREETDGLLQKIKRLEEENEKVRERERAAERREKGARKRESRVTEEMERFSEKIKGLEQEKAEAEKEKAETERREWELKGEIEKHVQKIECLEKEKAEPERRERELRGEIEKLMQKIECLEEEKAETERGEKEARGELEKLLQKIECLEKEKVEAERREREARGEIEEHLQKIKCLEDEKFAASEKRKKTIKVLKNRIDNTLTEDPIQNVSGDQAKSKAAYDEAQADVEDRLDISMKEEFNSQYSIHTPKLSGQSTNPSVLVSADKPTATLIIISDSESDDGGVHSPHGPHGLKRKRDSSGSSNTRSVDKANNENFTRNRESSPSMELSYGSVTHSPHADASWEFEADMLNAFDEDPILTMEAVCALYRQQKSRGTRPYFLGQGVLRNRGFEAFYDSRGTALAEFLLDGNPHGSMNKSVEELQLHDPDGLYECKKIADTHSKQLFEIYQRQEDPFFGPK